MSFNLVDLVKGQLGGPALGQLGALLGEDNNKTESALGAAIPGLLSGLTSSANADGGASLFNAVNDTDDSVLDNIGGMLTGNNSSSMMDQGSGILGSLLGNGAMGGLASAVAGLTGIGGKSSSGLMGMLAPIVLGIIKRKLFGGGGGFSQNAGGLLSLLNDQKSNVDAAMPSGFADKLQSSGFMDQISSLGGGVANAAGNAADAAGNAVSGAANTVGNAAGSVGNAAGNAVDGVGDAAASGGGFLKKFLPIAILVGLALLAWNFMKGDKTVDTSAVTDTASSTVDAAKGEMASLTGADFGSKMTGMFDSAGETLGGITDADSATAALPKLKEMGGSLDGLTGMFSSADDATKSAAAEAAGKGMESLGPIFEKLQGNEGIWGVLGPVLEPIIEKIKAFM